MGPFGYIPLESAWGATLEQGCAFACEFRKIRMRCENFAKFRIRIASQSRFQIRIIFAKCEQNFRMRKIRIMRNCRQMRLFAC